MHKMTGIFALRICQFVGFVIPWCIQCISYQTGAKFSEEIVYYIFCVWVGAWVAGAGVERRRQNDAASSRACLKPIHPITQLVI